jgi:uracil-DNA glycosylase
LSPLPLENLRSGAARFVPKTTSIAHLRRAAASCQGCDLYQDATQTVFGEGSPRSRLMFVGEQPGDVEDLSGRPFVGPAGRLLREAMREAEIDEDDVYVTNAVKHFRFVWRGKRRIHAKPRRIEIQACRPWLESEIEAVKPSVVVALGATAAQALLGPAFRLTRNRGRMHAADLAPRVIATVHPAAILRSPDAKARKTELAGFVADLRVAARTAKRTNTR